MKNQSLVYLRSRLFPHLRFLLAGSRKPWCGLQIEIKKGKNEKINPNQIADHTLSELTAKASPPDLPKVKEAQDAITPLTSPYTLSFLHRSI